MLRRCGRSLSPCSLSVRPCSFSVCPCSFRVRPCSSSVPCFVVPCPCFFPLGPSFLLWLRPFLVFWGRRVRVYARNGPWGFLSLGLLLYSMAILWGRVAASPPPQPPPQASTRLLRPPSPPPPPPPQRSGSASRAPEYVARLKDKATPRAGVRHGLLRLSPGGLVSPLPRYARRGPPGRLRLRRALGAYGAGRLRRVARFARGRLRRGSLPFVDNSRTCPRPHVLWLCPGWITGTLSTKLSTAFQQMHRYAFRLVSSCPSYTCLAYVYVFRKLSTVLLVAYYYEESNSLMVV